MTKGREGGTKYPKRPGEPCFRYDKTDLTILEGHPIRFRMVMFELHIQIDKWLKMVLNMECYQSPEQMGYLHRGNIFFI